MVLRLALLVEMAEAVVVVVQIRRHQPAAEQQVKATMAVQVIWAVVAVIAHMAVVVVKVLRVVMQQRQQAVRAVTEQTVFHHGQRQRQRVFRVITQAAAVVVATSQAARLVWAAARLAQMTQLQWRALRTQAAAQAVHGREVARQAVRVW